MTATQPRSDAWHDLLTTRYVCEICLTRYFTMRRRCPACNRFGHIRPLVSLLMTMAHDDEDLRRMIAQGQIYAEGDEKRQDEFQI